MSIDNTASRKPVDKLGGTLAFPDEETTMFSERARSWIGPLAAVIVAAAAPHVQAVIAAKNQLVGCE
jgi:hypothetical protein